MTGPTRDRPDGTGAPTVSSRRRFLFALGASSAGAAAVAAAPAVGAVAATTPAAPESTRGYRLTEHIRDYYESTRL
jgi:hypothetical protein